MATTLTIVARDPAREDADVHDDHGDVVLGTFLQRLRERRRDHELARAASVQQVGTALLRFVEERGHAPDVVQIIGHGRPGELLLGHGAWGRPDDPPKVAFLLNSDRRSYGALKTLLRHPCRVLVLGCTVGEPKALTAADGATLLFDLSHMWGCEVRAPVDDIDADDFDAGGRFLDDESHQARMTVAYGDRVVAGTSRPDAPTHGDPAPADLTLKRLTSTPGLGDFSRVVLDLTSAAAVAIVSQLVDLVGPPSERIPILAAPELEFDGTISGEPCKVEVVANSRYVRVTTLDSPTPRVYLVPSADRPRFKELLLELTTLAGVPPI